MSADVATAVFFGLKVSTILKTIIDAVTLLKDIPGALEGLRNLKAAFANIENKPVDKIDETSPLGQLAKGEEDNLKKLIEEFTAINLRNDIDDLTKEKHRKILAAQICRLLSQLQELFIDFVKDFDKLRNIFCNFAQAR